MTSIYNLTPEELEKMMYAIKEHLTLIKKDEEDEFAPKDRNQKITCKICKGQYLRLNKAKHCRTQKHKRELEFMETLRNLAKSKTLLGRTTKYM
ncbi:MAG TPA: hypothetical protein PKG56_00080 [Chitinophagaceae bacterium]|nr:hypothetical protein [Chitinophagaceae bacterium]HNL81763.1 hypothetical protein [Chitinophagaceae bacterium]